MGIMGLKHLLYYAETYPDRFRTLVKCQAERPVKNQYPVAAVGINISQLLISIFNIGTGNLFPFPSTRENKLAGDFAPHTMVYPFLLQGNISKTYSEFYCTVFEILDHKWSELNALYMEFNNVTVEVKVILFLSLLTIEMGGEYVGYISTESRRV